MRLKIRQTFFFYRREFRKFVKKPYGKFLLCFLFANIVAFLPSYEGLGYSGLVTLFILVFAATLWATETIPAYAVSLLIIFLNIVLIAYDGFDFSQKDANWQIYIEPCANPLIFLFIAGFIIGKAASKTKLDELFAKKILELVGNKPKNILAAILYISFLFSMFMSNTATAVMMLTLITPIVSALDKDDRFAKALLLAVCVGSNIGGMGTIIGTPSNAIAVGSLGENGPSFLMWSVYALPPSLLIATFLMFYLYRTYPSKTTTIDIKKITHISLSGSSSSKSPAVPQWKRTLTITMLFLTILLWLTSGLHGVPASVVAFLPIVVLTSSGILNSADIRTLHWDIIILIIGGLSLGTAVMESGLAKWFSTSFDVKSFSSVGFTLMFCYIIVIISNFMNSTSATNIIVPLVAAFATSFSSLEISMAVVCVGLSASFGITLPVSAPPNAVAYSVGRLEIKDFARIGIMVGLFGPLIVFSWIYLIF
ncbi:MAG: DASS family sodium-coupled anion symporter [Campylobacteraceae bacterium]|nr:DASS family sodium-coupled anion symporter [Campylobacteraceae bacterium]